MTHQTRGDSIIGIRLQVEVCANNEVVCTCAVSLSHPVNMPHHKLIAILSIMLIDLHTHSER